MNDVPLCLRRFRLYSGTERVSVCQTAFIGLLRRCDEIIDVKVLLKVKCKVKMQAVI